MIQLRQARRADAAAAMAMIDAAKRHLKEQGIDQWQRGYPDLAVIEQDLAAGKGWFATEDGEDLGYLCIDYDGEPAYNGLKGEWATGEPYVVVHRMAFSDAARGRGLSGEVFALVEEMSREKGVSSFRVDTDADNHKMRHVLEKNGFTYRGVIWFDYSEKIAFDKTI